MRINDDLKGKEVVDGSGNRVGEIRDVVCDSESNKAKSLIIIEGSSAKVGLEDKKIVSCTNVDSVGDKVVLK